jgi:hypothetical protein
MFDKLKKNKKIVKNSCGPIITIRGTVVFFENGQSLFVFMG